MDIKVTFFKKRPVGHRDRLAPEYENVPSLEVCKLRLNWALSNLI